MTFVYGDVCTGMSAASQAWMPLGAEPAFYAEVEAFPAGVLGARFGAGRPRHPLDPDAMPTEKERKHWIANNRELERMADRGAFGNGTPNLGDFTKIDPSEWSQVEWLVGGTPCQDFSIAGGRIGLSGHRGNLSLAFIGLCHELADTGSLRGAVWENVPGVLSDKKNAFGCFLGALIGHDAPIKSPHSKGRWTDAGVVVGPRARAAWRVLDAQHFGLAQRRRRVFVVVCFGDGPDPVRILFERKGVPRPAPAGSSAGQDVAGTIEASLGRSRGAGTPPGAVVPVAFGGNNQAGPIDIATARNAHGGPHGPHGRLDFESETFVVEPLPFDTTQMTSAANRSNPKAGDPCHPLVAQGHPPAVAFSIMPMNSGKDFKARETDVAQPVMAGGPVGGNQGGDYIVEPIGFNARQDPISQSGLSGPLDTSGHTSAIAFSLRGRDGESQIEPEAGDVAPALRTGEGGSSKSFVAQAIPILEPTKRTGRSTKDARVGIGIGANGDPMFTLQAGAQHAVAATVSAIRWAVRRLMPTECEALQGAARDFTRIAWRGKPADQCPDGPRYKVIGNSMAIKVMRWIGENIIEAEAEWRAAA